MSLSLSLQLQEPDVADNSPARAPREPHESLLAHYYRDVGRLPVLQARQEFEMARNLEQAEVDLWTHILSDPRLAGPILDLLERRLGEQAPELADLRCRERAARTRSVTSAALARYRQRSAEVAQQIRRLGRRAAVVKADVSEEEDVRAMMEFVGERFERLDVLVSNAASGGFRTLMEANPRHFDAAMHTNATMQQSARDFTARSSVEAAPAPRCHPHRPIPCTAPGRAVPDRRRSGRSRPARSWG